MGKAKETASNTTNTQYNVLASGTNLKGNVDTTEDFRIDGEIVGDILCQKKIVVGQSGSILGNIKCTNIEVFGQINGNIICKGTLILRSTSRLNGDIKMQVIEIEPGAEIMDSTISMLDGATQQEFSFSEA